MVNNVVSELWQFSLRNLTTIQLTGSEPGEAAAEALKAPAVPTQVANVGEAWGKVGAQGQDVHSIPGLPIKELERSYQNSETIFQLVYNVFI